MQSAPVLSIARKIKALRKTGLTYRDIAERLNIASENSSPDPGMVKQIEQGYEPRKESTRARLGLPPKARRRSYRPNEEYMVWWRFHLRSNQRRAFIKSLFDMQKTK